MVINSIHKNKSHGARAPTWEFDRRAGQTKLINLGSAQDYIYQQHLHFSLMSTSVPGVCSRCSVAAMIYWRRSIIHIQRRPGPLVHIIIIIKPAAAVGARGACRWVTDAMFVCNFVCDYGNHIGGAWQLISAPRVTFGT